MFEQQDQKYLGKNPLKNPLHLNMRGEVDHNFMQLRYQGPWRFGYSQGMKLMVHRDRNTESQTEIATYRLNGPMGKSVKTFKLQADILTSY